MDTTQTGGDSLCLQREALLGVGFTHVSNFGIEVEVPVPYA
jgi:hypothetical protein